MNRLKEIERLIRTVERTADDFPQTSAAFATLALTHAVVALVERLDEMTAHSPLAALRVYDSSPK